MCLVYSMLGCGYSNEDSIEHNGGSTFSPLGRAEEWAKSLLDEYQTIQIKMTNFLYPTLSLFSFFGGWLFHLQSQIFSQGTRPAKSYRRLERYAERVTIFLLSAFLYLQLIYREFFCCCNDHLYIGWHGVAFNVVASIYYESPTTSTLGLAALSYIDPAGDRILAYLFFD